MTNEQNEPCELVCPKCGGERLALMREWVVYVDVQVEFPELSHGVDLKAVFRQKGERTASGRTDWADEIELIESCAEAGEWEETCAADDAEETDDSDPDGWLIPVGFAGGRSEWLTRTARCARCHTEVTGRRPALRLVPTSRVRSSAP